MSFKNGQWMYNSSPDGIWSNFDYYETKEEAITGGKEYYDRFYVGQIVTSNIGVGVNASRILEDITESVYDEVGEPAEDYLHDVTRKDEVILEERLNKVLLEWMDEFHYKPNFFKIDNVQKIELDNEN
jgi:hypothetical protein